MMHEIRISAIGTGTGFGFMAMSFADGLTEWARAATAVCGFAISLLTLYRMIEHRRNTVVQNEKEPS